jgi:hypothetical protein
MIFNIYTRHSFYTLNAHAFYLDVVYHSHAFYLDVVYHSHAFYLDDRTTYDEKFKHCESRHMILSLRHKH